RPGGCGTPCCACPCGCSGTDPGKWSIPGGGGSRRRARCRARSRRRSDVARTRSGGPVQPRNPKTPSTKRAPGRRRRTTALCAVLAALALVPAGCWDHRPPDGAAFIILLGFDVHPEAPAMPAATRLATLPGAFAVGNEGSGGLDQTPFYLLRDAAPTLESAQAAVFDR